MAGIFNYNPQVGDDRAEIISRAAPVIAENFRRGFESLGEHMSTLKARHDELKAKKALAEAFATQLGQDPKTVEKMKLPQVDAFLALAPAKIETQRQQQQSQVLGNALKSFFTAQQPKPAVPPMGAMYSSTVNPPAATPGAAPGDALTAALASAAGEGATPDTLSSLGSLAKTIGGMYSRGMATDPGTGLKLFNGKILPAATQKLLGAGGAPDNQFQFTPGPSGTQFWSFGTRGGEVRPPAPAARPAESYPTRAFPKGTTFGVQGGTRTATTPDGTVHELGAAPGTGAGPAANIVEDTLNGKTGSGNTAPAATPAAAPAVTYKTQDEVVAAYKAGSLSYDDAAAILNKQFNVPVE